MNMPQCPCYNCICVPVCRHKTFGEVIACPLIEKYVSTYNLQSYFLCRISIHKSLKSTRWAVDYDDGRFIQYKRNGDEDND